MKRIFVALVATVGLLAGPMQYPSTLLAQPALGATLAVDLSPQFENAPPIRYRYEIRSDQTMSAFGSDQESQSHMKAEIERVILGAHDTIENAYRIGVTYQKLALKFDGGHVPGHFDSDDPNTHAGDNVYAIICKPMVGRQIEIAVDRSGTIRRVENLSAIAPDGLTGILFEQLFGEDALRAMLQPMFQIHDPNAPSSRVAIGESWSVERSGSRSLGMPSSEVKLELQRMEQGSIGVIQVEGKPEAEIPDGASVLPNIKSKEATLSGLCRWDTARGSLLSLQTEAVNRLESDAQGITIRIRLVSATKLERLSN